MLRNKIKSLAFCCIATGSFNFPRRKAAEIALSTTRMWLQNYHQNIDRIIFCIFEDDDDVIYKELMPIYFPSFVDFSGPNFSPQQKEISFSNETPNVKHNIDGPNNLDEMQSLSEVANYIATENEYEYPESWRKLLVYMAFLREMPARTISGSPSFLYRLSQFFMTLADLEIPSNRTCQISHINFFYVL